MTQETEWGYSMGNNPDLTRDEQKRWALFLAGLGISTGSFVILVFSMLSAAV